MGMFGGGFAAKLGQAGDILTGNPIYAQRQQQEMENDFKRKQLEWQQRREEAQTNRPQAVPLGGGGFGTWSPNTGLEILREPAEAATPSSEAERLIRLATDPNTPPEQAELARSAVRGQYTPAMQQQQHDRQVLKSQPTYSAAHPKPAAPKYEYRMGPNGQLQRRQVN